jgi:acetyl-CoA carboxylase biotin carboxyl carrier protein
LDFDDIERILELMRRHDLSEFELEREGLKIRVRKTSTGYAPVITPAPIAPTGNVGSAPPLAPGPLTSPATQQLPSALVDVDETTVELAIVKSPIVGTFYLSPEPGAPSFVEVGEYVKKDQVLCIIEAMKLMNEITSEYEGEISMVYVENGKPVQYGERLFAIKTA